MSGRLLVKRRYPRRMYRRPIGILIGGVYSLFPGEEVGEGGLSLIAPAKVGDSQGVVVTFALEGELHVMKGEVRYQAVKGPGQVVMGIAFQNIAFKYKKMIRRYIGAKTEEELALELRSKSM